MTEPVVLVVGSLHYDIMVEAQTLPRRDETAVGSRWYPKFGGKGGNQAVAARRAGAVARLCGAVGDDDFGRFLRERLRAGGVDDRFVAEVDGAGSGMSVAIVDAAGDYAATIVSGANLLISPDALREAALWDGVAMLVLQNEVPEAVNLAAAGQARARGIRTLLNAAPSRPMSAEFTALVDILVVNAVEAEMMGAGVVATLGGAAEAARDLANPFSTVIVTAGAQGLAAWSGSEGALLVPARKVAAVSSHGAGDAFIGTLAARLAKGDSFAAACDAASASAARHVAGLVP
ncbi:PfkB family carbohydrate kinase [Tabrizicola sp.]|uniref:PfkB family carbohydrate kinase n=1 Tax=Tabrizicola sp. TaxID=2005166 RepID=UPI00286C41D8|nr:PfkB family carbohydrate kinase [Tabrizicola sp.]